MFKVLIIIIVILALFLCFVVTIQNSKGGGLAAGFASSNQIMGVRKTTDILEKTTWTLMASIAVLSIITVEGDAIENQYTNPESSTTTFDAPLEIEDFSTEE